MRLRIDGKEVEIPFGGGSTPVGTVISFLGMSAPDGYLLCDGAEYEIAAYPALAKFFEDQFGKKNHFGGDGVATFSVPDMRNLFLRGYHGEADEQLSGDIGARQEATEHLHFSGASNGGIMQIRPQNGERIDQRNVERGVEQTNKYAWVYTNYDTWGPEETVYAYYTSRPVNMAVLYCVKCS